MKMKEKKIIFKKSGKLPKNVRPEVMELFRAIANDNLLVIDELAKV